MPLLIPGILGILPPNRAPQRRHKNNQGRAHHEVRAYRRIHWRRVAISRHRWGGHAQQNFPDRPIRLIIPYSVGSVTDVFGRIVAQNMAEQWKGTILNESKSGGNGSIAAEEVARAAPDGYTWLLVTTFFTASPSLNVSLKWDPVRDFIPIGQICRAPNFFIVPTTLPVKNVAEYVALAKEKPGKLNYSHPGKGSTGHLGFELFKRLAGIDVPGIGYRGYPQMVADISSGPDHLDLPVRQPGAGQVQTGSIRIIGAIDDGRSKYFPDVPTMAEQGYAEAQVTALVRHRGGERDAGTDRRPHQQGARRRPAIARRPAEARSGGMSAQGGLSDRVRGSHQGRRGAVGQGGQGRRDPAGLGLSRGLGPRGSPEVGFRRIKPYCQ